MPSGEWAAACDQLRGAATAMKLALPTPDLALTSRLDGVLGALQFNAQTCAMADGHPILQRGTIDEVMKYGTQFSVAMRDLGVSGG